jgi:hypothetical protein
VADDGRHGREEAAWKDAEWKRIIEEPDVGRAEEMIVQLEGERWVVLNYAAVVKAMAAREELLVVFERARKDRS